MRSAKGRVLRRRLFRRVTVVDFAAAIAAAEERGESSHGDMDTPQTIAEETVVRVFCRVCRLLDSAQANRAMCEPTLGRKGGRRVDGVWTWNPALERLGEPDQPPSCDGLNDDGQRGSRDWMARRAAPLQVPGAANLPHYPLQRPWGHPPRPTRRLPLSAVRQSDPPVSRGLLAMCDVSDSPTASHAALCREGAAACPLLGQGTGQPAPAESCRCPDGVPIDWTLHAALWPASPSCWALVGGVWSEARFAGASVSCLTPCSALSPRVDST